jgi:hypothetical protein
MMGSVYIYNISVHGLANIEQIMTKGALLCVTNHEISLGGGGGGNRQ